VRENVYKNDVYNIIMFINLANNVKYLKIGFDFIYISISQNKPYNNIVALFFTPDIVTMLNSLQSTLKHTAVKMLKLINKSLNLVKTFLVEIIYLS